MKKIDDFTNEHAETNRMIKLFYSFLNMSLTITILAVAILAQNTFAKSGNVNVRGYYRSNGTYVQPHVRAAPNQYKYDNLGPSKNSFDRANPYQRDNDNDGITNQYDTDDNNNGIHDDADSNQYGN